jgi:predicted PurR-regulated permease PerM
VEPTGILEATQEQDILKQIRNALRGLLVLTVLAGMYYAQDFLLPLVLAIFIALTFRPVVTYFSARRIPPWITATLFVSCIVIGGLYASYLIASQASVWIEQAPEISRKIGSKLQGLRASLEAVSSLNDTLQKATDPSTSQQVQQVVVRESSIPTVLVYMTGYPKQLLITLGATLVFAVFLMASGDLFYEKLIRVLPKLRDKKLALHIAYDIEDQVSDYVLTMVGINASLGIAVALSFQALGMPTPYVWGLLTFLLNFLPYVGAATVLFAISAVALVAFDSIGQAALIPLTFVMWSLLESEIVSPLILGRRLQMNSVAILLSLAFWAWMWGIFGAALAVPMLVAIKVFCDHIDSLSGLGEFIAVRRVEPGSEQLASSSDGVK